MKKILKKIMDFIKSPLKIFIFLNNRKILVLSDEKYLKVYYKSIFHKKLNLDNPVTFNEKLQWLKIHDKNPQYSKMVDKYETKTYTAEIIGKKYIIPTLGIYDRFEDIDFEKLPNQFVIKCTHDSGGVLICKDKNRFNVKDARKKVNKSLKRDFYNCGREWPYKNVKPRIIIEEYIIDKSINELQDYKFFCFNGKTKFFKIDFNRFIEHHANYYDTNCKLLPFGEKTCLPDYNKKIEIPSNIYKMIELAERLSKDIPFVRVDFYNVNGQILFGEMTFYPAAGFGKFEPEEWDRKLGDMLDLPKQEIEEKNEK